MSGGVNANAMLIEKILSRPREVIAFKDAPPHTFLWQQVPLNHFEINSDSAVSKWVSGILANPNQPVTAISFSSPQSFAVASEEELSSGFASFESSSSSSSGPGDAPEAQPMEEGGEAGAALPMRLVDFISDEIAAGSVATLPVPLDQVASLSVTLAAGGNASLRVVRPDGQALDESNAAGFPGVTFEKESGPEGTLSRLAVSEPAAGGWQVLVDASSLEDDCPYEVTVEAGTEISLAVTHQEWVNSGLMMPFGAALGHSTNGIMVPTTATMSVWIQMPDGTTLVRTMADDGSQGDGEAGDGVFGLLQGDLVQPGEYRVVVKFNGQLPDIAHSIRRASVSEFKVAATGAFVSGGPKWSTFDGDDNGLIDAILVDVPVTVTAQGDYSITGLLRDVENDVEMTAVTEFYREGESNGPVTLRFNPRELPQKKTFGPFTLAELKIFRSGADDIEFLDCATPGTQIAATLFNPAARSIRVNGGIAFGTVPVAQEAERELEVFNDGWMPIEIQSIGLTDPFFSAEQAIVPARGSLKFAVLFRPSGEGEFGGNQTILSDADEGGNQFSVSGRGGPEEIPLADWLSRKGVPAEKRGPLDDPGGGLPNVLAYLFNINPVTGATVADQHARPIPGVHQSLDGDMLSIKFRRNRNAINLAVVVEESETLAPDSWQPAAPAEVVEGETDPATADPLVEVRVPIGNAKKKFLRIKVTQEAGE